MMYRTQIEFLPDSVIGAINVLQQELAKHTDFEGVQITFVDDVVTMDVQTDH